MGFIEDELKPLIDQVVAYFGTVHNIIGDHSTLTEPSVIEQISANQISLQSSILSLINDSLATGTVNTYSIDKIKEIIQVSKDSILGSVTTGANTLEKIEALINGIDTTISVMQGDISVLQAIVGDPALLDTVEKNVLVRAINEVLTYSQNIIDDTATTGTTDKTYSADKLLQLYQQLKDDILGGAGNAYDTLIELQNELQDNDVDIASLLNEQAKRVAVNITQSFTALEQGTARNNIGVYSTIQVDALIASLQSAVTDLENEQGDKGDLTTGLSGTIVQAINWLHIQQQNLANTITNISDDLIDDNAGLGTFDKAFSADKILQVTNNLQTLITTLISSVGVLPDLDTTEKSNLVEAINEIYNMAQGVASIDDMNITTTTTYSSQKIEDSLTSLKNEILGGASAAYDTLIELQNAIQDNDTDITQILTNIAQLSVLTSSIANDRVAYNIDQTATTSAGQKGQARTNIDVYSKGEVDGMIGGTTDDDVALSQALPNINVTTANDQKDFNESVNNIIGSIQSILTSNDPALDTFQKIVDFIKNNESDITALQTALGSINEDDIDLVNNYSNIPVGTGDTQQTFNEEVDSAIGSMNSNINDLQSDKIDKSSIINDLTTGGVTNVLSAQQGVVLKGLIDNITSLLSSDNNALDTLQEIVDYVEANRDDLSNLAISNIAGLQTNLTSLQNQINQLNTTTGNVYTKTEVDNLLAGKSDVNHNHDNRYYTETETDSRLALKSDINHNHDSRYYTEAEVNALLAAKANSVHTHDDRYYTEAQSDLKYGTGLSTITAPGNKVNIRLEREDGGIIAQTPLSRHVTIDGATGEFGAFAQDGTLVRVAVNNGVITSIVASTTYGGSTDHIAGDIW